MRFLAALFLLSSLAGCAGIPLPFRHTEQAAKDNPLVVLQNGRGVLVKRPLNLPEAEAEALAQAMTEALIAQGVPAIIAPPPPAPLPLMGYVMDGEKKGEAVVWTLRDQGGSTVAGITGDDDPAALGLLRQAGKVALALRRDPGAETAPAGPPLVRIGPVTGVPEAVARRLQAALAALLRPHVRLLQPGEPDPSPAEGYVVEGRVTLGEPEDGSRLVRAAWMLKDPTGEDLADIAQQNPVPASMLSGDWGALPAAIAEGAAEGILSALRATEERRRPAPPPAAPLASEPQDSP